MMSFLEYQTCEELKGFRESKSKYRETLREIDPFNPSLEKIKSCLDLVHNSYKLGFKKYQKLNKAKKDNLEITSRLKGELESLLFLSLTLTGVKINLIENA